MKILVTGGAGFIGSHIAEVYLEAGHDVVVVDDLSSGKRDQVPAGARFYQIDICDAALNEVFRVEQPDIVNHQAAQVSVPNSMSDPIKDAATNVTGFINVLENARISGVCKLIFASSCAVYGDPDQLPVGIDTQLMPLSPYGQSKWTGEQYLSLYRRLYGLEFIAFRYANVYGPRQDPFGEAGVITIFIERMLDRSSVTIYGDGEQTRDFVFVKDVAQANLSALASDKDGVFNVGTGHATTINQLFRILQGLTDFPAEAVHGASRAGDIRHSVIDPAPAMRSLGWQANTPMEIGLTETVAYFEKQVAS